MKAFLPLLSLLLCLTSLHAQPLNPQDPASVAKHYLNACEKWDLDAAAQVVSTPAEVRGLEKLTTEVPVGFEQLLMELLCLPAAKHTTYTLGEIANLGEECRIAVTATYTIPQTLVLRKAPDGSWRVALEETILSTTGQEYPMILNLNTPEADCLANLRQIGTGIQQYAQDHDEVLPSADKWMDEIMPYMRNEQVLKCPDAPDLAYGYAFNTALSRVSLAKVDKPAEVITVFESDRNTRNAHGDPTEVPKPGRHNNGNNVGYVDGHCKLLKAD